MKKLLLPLFLTTVTLIYAQTKEQKVNQLMDVMGMTKNMTLVFDQMISHYNTSYPEVPEIFWTKFRNNIDFKSLEGKLGVIYTKYYTSEDIDGLIKFYQSPLGQKTMTTLPNIMQESMAIGQEWGLEIGKKVLSELEKEGYLQNPPSAR